METQNTEPFSYCLFGAIIVKKHLQNYGGNKIIQTSKDIIAEDGREWFVFEKIFQRKVFLEFCIIFNYFTIPTAKLRRFK